jgi:hypothetical protein
VAEPGFMVAANHLKDFASNGFGTASGRYGKHTTGLPKFEGSDYIPMVGLPLVGLLFAGDYNSVTDTISTAFGEMKRVTGDADTKLTSTANAYITVEQKNQQNAKNAHP